MAPGRIHRVWVGQLQETPPGPWLGGRGLSVFCYTAADDVASNPTTGRASPGGTAEARGQQDIIQARLPHAEGLAKLKAGSTLITVDRPRIAARIHEAKLDGDLSENAEYEDPSRSSPSWRGASRPSSSSCATPQSSRRRTATASGSARRWSSRAATARRPSRSSGRRGRPAGGPHQNESPVGAALRGRKKGETVTVQHPPGRSNTRSSASARRVRCSGLTSSPRGRRSAGVHDSKTPSGTVHVGSLRGPVVVDRSCARCATPASDRAALRRRRLDPMDAQALLTPDAIERSMACRSLTSPTGGDCHASYARHFAQVFIDTFDGLGIRPDTYYWMTRSTPPAPWTDTSAPLSMRRHDSRDLRWVANVRHADNWHRVFSSATTAALGTTIVTAGRGAVHYECRADLVTWATAAAMPARLALRRSRQAAIQRGLCGEVGAVRRDDRARRQGPGDGGRLARPLGRHRARGVRQRAAAQRAIRVPQHPRPEDVRPRRGWGRRPRARRGHPARALATPLPAPRPNTAIEFDPEGTDAIPRLFDESTALPPPQPPRGAWQLPPPRAALRPGLVEPDADVAAEAAAYRPAFQPPCTARTDPGHRLSRARHHGEGIAVDRSRARAPRGTACRRTVVVGVVRARSRSALRPARRAAAAADEQLDDAQRTYLAALASSLETAAWDGESVQGAISTSPSEHELPAGRPSPPSISHSCRGSGPRAGWLLAALERDFVIGRLREAATAGVRRGVGLQRRATSRTSCGAPPPTG